MQTPQDIYNNPILPDNLDELYSVKCVFTPNAVSHRCFEKGISVTEDQVIHVMHVVEERVKETGSINWEAVDEIVLSITGKSELLDTITSQNQRIVRLVKTVDFLNERIRNLTTRMKAHQCR